MSNLRDVIDEREHAINMLTHGTPDKIGGKLIKFLETSFILDLMLPFSLNCKSVS